jgi:hypothetical protein
MAILRVVEDGSIRYLLDLSAGARNVKDEINQNKGVDITITYNEGCGSDRVNGFGAVVCVEGERRGFEDRGIYGLRCHSLKEGKHSPCPRRRQNFHLHCEVII